MIITADIDYIMGHLRYGHYELDLDAKDYEYYINLSDEEKVEYIQENGYIVIDDYEIDDIGIITKIND